MRDQDQQQQTGQPAHEREPMTAARLEEIMSLTADVVAGRIQVRFDEETAWLAILDLRREVERQRDRLAFAEAALPILRAVAEFTVNELPLAFTILPDGRYVAVLPESLAAIQRQARALLAGMASGDGERGRRGRERAGMSIAEDDRKRIAALRAWAERSARWSPPDLIVGMTWYEWEIVIGLLADFDTRLSALEPRATAPAEDASAPSD